MPFFSLAKTKIAFAAIKRKCNGLVITVIIPSFVVYVSIDFYIQMVSERQRIEASPSPVVEDPMPPPPSYEEVNGVYSSQTVDGSTDAMGYFLGEVINSLSMIQHE